MAKSRKRRSMGVVRVDCSDPGIARKGAGKGFVYIDERGRKVTSPAVMERIRRLAIPPAWTDVWICSENNGHLQAVGTDAAGRRQYLYHKEWRRQRDQRKFDQMLEFASALPDLRMRIAADLGKPGFQRDRVLACAVRLLDRGFFRIGTESYATQNGTVGLATMRKSHVQLGPKGLLSFDYPAKGGKRRVQSVVDLNVYNLVGALKRRRGGGAELLAYKNRGDWIDVRSSDINSYIKHITGDAFTSKDFRTWNATVLAAVTLAVWSANGGSPTKRAITAATREVAHYLGNTPAICRSSYIDHRIFDRYMEGATIIDSSDSLGLDNEYGEPAVQGKIEHAVLELLEERPTVRKTA